MTKLIGSEKQIAWAQNIIDDVTATCNLNIEKFEKINFHDTVAQYKKALETLKAVSETKNGQDAGWIINHRDMFYDLVGKNIK